MWVRITTFVVILLVLSGCAPPRQSSAPTVEPTPSVPMLRIAAGGQVKLIEDIIRNFPKSSQIQISTLGAQDIRLKLERGDTDIDAAWPESDMWLRQVKTNSVRNEAFTHRTPVVFALQRPLAERFGWVNNPDVTMATIVDTVKRENLRLGVSSATQSTCGAVWFLTGVYAFSGSPDVITEANLQDDNVRQQLKQMNELTNRSSVGCNELMEYFLANSSSLDAMVNTEANLIATNQKLTRDGKQPLYVMYPKGGTFIANATLGYVDRGDAVKYELFKEFQSYLARDDVRKQIEARGYRTYTLGPQVSPDQQEKLKDVFNTNWGIIPAGRFDQLTMPNATVVRMALDLYQTGLRKGSATAMCLDYSGSMSESGTTRDANNRVRTREAEMKDGVAALLDPNEAARYQLQTSPDDLTVVLLFRDDISDNEIWYVKGNNPDELRALLKKVRDARPGGNTNIHGCITKALQTMQTLGIDGRLPSIIVMTDGQGNRGPGIAGIRQAMPGVMKAANLDRPVPAQPIQYGNADPNQLNEIAKETGASSPCKADAGLIDCFRRTRGEN